MSPDLFAWVLIIGLGVIAFAARALFILPGSRLRLPETVERVLRYAPAAALAAIIAPDLFRVDGVVQASLSNPRLIAGGVAIVVAARTRHMLLTIVCGMGVLLLLEALAG